MTDTLPPIYFYIPQEHWPAGGMPERPDNYWQWNISISNKWNWGRYNWTLQTYLYLKADGFPCELIGTMPTEGIVLAHRDFFPDNFQPGPRLLMTCLQADRKPHPYAQIHVVQNQYEERLKKSMSLWESYYIAHWPQPGLIPRAPARGKKFENVAYFGNENTLAPELKNPLWQEQLTPLGLCWHIVERDHWNDYSEVDVVVAIRSFDGNDYTWKPASKLYNAWQAGVPAILGCESAYRFERKSELDYLEVASLNDLISALKRLRDDKELRQAIVENGLIRALETRPARIVVQWRTFLTDTAVPAYNQWCTAPNWERQKFLKLRYLILKLNKIKLRLKSVSSRVRAALKK